MAGRRAVRRTASDGGGRRYPMEHIPVWLAPSAYERAQQEAPAAYVSDWHSGVDEEMSSEFDRVAAVLASRGRLAPFAAE